MQLRPGRGLAVGIAPGDTIAQRAQEKIKALGKAGP